MSAPWHAARSYEPPEENTYATYLRDEHLSNISAAFRTSSRSGQVAIGSSEIGWECDRRLAYRLHGVPVVNHSDPTKAITGTGWHLWMENVYRAAMDTYRYRVEYECRYRNVVGHGDLYDRQRRVAFDWKTSTKDRIRTLRRNGVPHQYYVQVNHNALALQVQQFEQPSYVALMFIATDGALTDSWLWLDEPNFAVVDHAIDRVERLRLVPPEQAEMNPSRDCGYCRWYDPQSTDPTKSCNARKGKR